MVTKDILQLAERFRGLELHAAHSGREVLRVLIKLIDESQQTTLTGLAEEVQENIRFLLRWLPPYAPPLNNINRVLLVLEDAIAAGESAGDVKGRLEALRTDAGNPQASQFSIASHLNRILPPKAIVYTHTLSETVLGVLLELHRLGRLSLVVVTESRPNNDGWDTARRLAERSLQVELTIDAAMPAAIEKAHLMLSGAEIIRPDGSVVGKIGAYPAALLCQRYRKPLYIVADSNKISNITWKDFYLNEITENALGLEVSHPSLRITGSYFDITPAHLINAYATEKGLLDLTEVTTFVSGRKVSAWLAQRLEAGLTDKPTNRLRERQI